jgi:formiminoglutamase
MKFQSLEQNLFFTKNDNEDRRLGDFAISSSSLSDLQTLKPSLCLWGYPDDEGIVMNGGRPGAKLGPQEIRYFFYRMTAPETDLSRIIDFGNVDTKMALAERHEQGRSLAHAVCQSQIPFIALGGGHDYGYSEASGFLSATRGGALKPVVINIDAHLDVRPTDKGFHSGTPFRRILTEFKNDFHFFEVGLQAQCNSPSHAKWAEQNGAHLFWMADKSSSELLDALTQALLPFKNHPLFLSVDIDGFSSSIAPGCSQSWPTGLELAPFLKLLRFLKSHFQLAGLGIYEVSPPLDLDKVTAKLAAVLAYHFAFETSQGAPS